MLLQNLQAEFAELLLTTATGCEFISPLSRVIIYRNNFFSTLIQTLKDTYPLIKQLLGEDFFEITAKHYIKHYPSTSGDLHEYGEYFSDFLKEYQPVKHLLYVSEVATFEWLCHRVYFAAEHKGLDLTHLAMVSDKQYDCLHFNLHPACVTKYFQYPILAIIDLCNQHNEETLNVDNDDGIPLLIKRCDGKIKLETLSPGDFTFLNAIQNDFSLSDALTKTLEIAPDFQLETKLPQWVASHIIVEMYLTT